MTALQLVQKVLVEKLRLNSVSTIAGASGYTLNVLWALNEIQRELLDDYNWKKLKKTGSITLANGTDLYDLASDIHRMLNLYYQVDDGSDDDIPQITLVPDNRWIVHSAQDVTDGKPYIAREFGVSATNVPQIQVYYIPGSAQVGTKIYYDYIKQVSDLSANADLSPFDDHLLILGATLKLKDQNGNASGLDFDMYLAAKNKAMMRDGANRGKKLAYRDI